MVMEENKKVDVLSKKRPTVNELKTEVIRLRKDLDKSNAGLNHYKYTYERVSSEQKNLIDKCSELITSISFLEANNKALKDTIASLEVNLAKIKKDCEELKAKNQYNSSAFVIATIIALGAVITMILRLV
jgi:predicted RNase H-like nuclease (RuvC/YqgF family)